MLAAFLVTMHLLFSTIQILLPEKCTNRGNISKNSRYNTTHMCSTGESIAMIDIAVLSGCNTILNQGRLWSNGTFAVPGGGGGVL